MGNDKWLYVAEVHDIGKLFLKGLKHNLEDLIEEFKKYGIGLEWPIVQSILKHHCKLSPKDWDIQLYPDSYETLLVHLADMLASQASRILRKLEAVLRKYKLGINYRVYKLWKGTISISDAPPLYGRDYQIFEYIKSDPSGRNFLRRFRRYLLIRAENALNGANITTLYSHSILAGKFFRLLYKYYYKKICSIKINFNKRDDVCEKAHIILNSLPIILVYARIMSPQYIYRVKDLNVFKIIKDILKEFEGKYQDHILYRGFNDILFVDIPSASIHKELISRANEYGFYVDIQALYSTPCKGNNRILGINPRKIAKRFNFRRKMLPINGYKQHYLEYSKDKYEDRYIYPELENYIKPPICDICQLRPATKTWIDEESGLIEHLCEKCYRVRTYTNGLYKLAAWSEGTVAWVRISLNIEDLEASLVELYIEYLRRLGIHNARDLVIAIEKEEGLVSPTLLQEFLWDYYAFLEKIENLIFRIFPTENIEGIDKSFYVIKIERSSDVITFTERYNSLLQIYFQQLVQVEEYEPITLGISISHVKYPFHKHWRLLSNIGRGFLLHIHRKGLVEASYKELNATLQFFRSPEIIERRRALYKALEIANYSRLLAKLELRKHLKHIPRKVNLQLLRMLLELER